MIDIKHALMDAVNQLTKSSPSARLDAELLLGHALHQSRTHLYTHPENTLTASQQQRYDELLSKRLAGAPMAYLTGTREFWSLPLHVNENTLIPRPETEQLIELTLTLLGDKPQASLLDLGTGSGAIACALASERPNWHILACDKSPEALLVARENASQLKLNNIDFVCSDWFESIPYQPVHAIISNPPYLEENDPHLLEGDVRFEPNLALVSGADGLNALRYLIEKSVNWLLPEGLLLLEHGFSQGALVTDHLKQWGYEHVQCWQDVQGHDRVSGGFRKK
jgi:release factor glutamine methyltransferase